MIPPLRDIPPLPPMTVATIRNAMIPTIISMSHLVGISFQIALIVGYYPSNPDKHR